MANIKNKDLEEWCSCMRNKHLMIDIKVEIYKAEIK